MAFVVGQAISDANALPVQLKSSDEPVKVEAVSASNVTTKFREAFETFDLSRWAVTLGPNDIVTLDGNAAACSYLVISKDPWSAGSMTLLESKFTFDMPIDAAIGLHTSQRTLGQELAIEYVSVEAPRRGPADVSIASISQNGNTLTVNTTVNHNLSPGMRVSIVNCPNSRFNYPALVVNATPSPTQFVVASGPMGALPSLNAGPVTGGTVSYRPALGGAQNGMAMIFENSTTTSASFYARAESGDVLPSGTINGSHSVGISDSSFIQVVSSPGTYAFQPRSEYRLTAFLDHLQFSDVAIDSNSQPSSRRKVTQVVPAVDTSYKLRFRATNNASLTRPIATVASATKSGSATATIVCDRPHGLTTGDYVQIFGTRDQAAFPALSTPTVVASVVNATTFTVVWGSATSATTIGGFVARVNGQIAMQGVLGAVVSVARTSNLLTLTGSSSWSGFYIGDYVNIIGCRSAVDTNVGVDGAYRVRAISGASLVLEPITNTVNAPNIASTNCGGAVVKRTDLRISYVRLLQFDRLRVESMARPGGDSSTAFPVVVQSGSLGIYGGQANEDASAGNSTVVVGGIVRTAPITTPTAGDAMRHTSSVGGLLITEQHGVPELTWNYAAAAGGIVNSATAVPVKGAAGSGVRNYVDALHIAHDALGGATEFAIRDGAAGTVLWRAKLQTPASESSDIHFDPPLRGSANTLLEVVTLTAVTGGVYVNLQGHTGP